MSAGVAGVLPPPVVYMRKPKGHHVRATRTRTHTHTWTYPPTENTRNTRTCPMCPLFVPAVSLNDSIAAASGGPCGVQPSRVRRGSFSG